MVGEGGWDGLVGKWFREYWLVPIYLDSACFWQDIFRGMRFSQYPRACGGILQ